MGRVTMEGRWRVRVVGNDADFPQRIVITGSTSLIVPGVVGKSFEASGKRWTLGVEHQPFGRGAWCLNAFTNSQQLTGDNGQPVTMLRSKDVHWQGDDNPDDLVLRLERLDGPAVFQIVESPCAVDHNLRPMLMGFSDARARFLAVGIANAGGEPFSYDAALEISATGRTALARQGVEVLPWTTDSERATGQEVFGSAVSVPPLSPGQRVAVYFPVDGSSAKGGRVDVEFELRRVGKSGAQRQTARDVSIVPDASPAPRQADTVSGRSGLAASRGIATSSGSQMQASGSAQRLPATPGSAGVLGSSGAARREGSTDAAPWAGSRAGQRSSGSRATPLGKRQA